MDDRQVQRINEMLTIVGGVLTIMLTARLVLGPDGVTRMKMHAYSTTARMAKQQSEWWSKVSLDCYTRYNQCRNVVL